MLHILNFCKPYFKKYRWMLAIHWVLFLTVTSTSIIIPYISGSFIDNLIYTEDTSFIKKYVVAFIIIGLIEIFVGYAVERLYCIIQIKVGHSMNVDAIHHVQNVTSQYIQKKDPAYLNDQINNDTNMVSMFCIMTPEDTALNILTVLVPLVLVSMMEPLLGIAMIVLDVLCFLVYILVKKPMYEASYEFSEEQANYFAKLNEQLCNVKFIQTHGIGESFISRLDASIKVFLQKLLKEQKVSRVFNGSSDTLKTISNILVFIIGGAAVVSKSMTIGDFTIIMSYFAMSIGATQYFFTLGESIQQNKVFCDRLKKVFDVTEQTNGSVMPYTVEDISCRNLTFGYGESEVISKADFDFKKGKIYALVGENGSGKSTLINLMLGLYVDEYEGDITYGGIPIEKLDMRRIRNKLVGVSEQEPMLLPESLRFNLTFDDNKEIDQKEFASLCSMLDLDAFLKSLPEGLDTVINQNSGNLSGGEKQKISILRALLKKPPLLILDEPTSALDKASRKSLCSYLKTISPNSIIVISTHDKELLDICDETIHIENGKKVLSTCKTS